MKHPAFFRLLFASLLVLLCAASQAQELKAVPPLQTRVTDLAGMLTPDERETLEKTLRDYEAEKGSQIALLLVDSTEPESIEQYSIRVVDAWKLGREGVDDGVLLLVAKNNPPALNRLRIESGRGTEGVLTDIQAKRILQDVIAPRFRLNDFYGGLSAGVSAIIATLNQEEFAPPAEKEQQASQIGSWLSFFIMLLFIFILIRSRRRGAFLSGIILGGSLGRYRGRDDDRFGGGGFGGGGGGFSGGGGGFSGGGASGNW
ncbi:TPM domain-containing protein [Oxalobacter vibrioformis]|uniref:TPM domain-containing protein n=1 Tax=Oxalobacter vibrioformis TaxID=933080 RepID=A0A9E9M225_9BURK|nr:TPM domain-containing protein [Oxalobacter vibrioformis]NLC24138.1 YgcG family protein [Oxalobacter sp.]WAW11328.1 TPM domain-containing protein [Oxalobacter vibrioformis]